MTEWPCKGCAKRHEACWGHCEEYKAYNQDQLKLKRQMAMERWMNTRTCMAIERRRRQKR